MHEIYKIIQIVIIIQKLRFIHRSFVPHRKLVASLELSRMSLYGVVFIVIILIMNRNAKLKRRKTRILNSYSVLFLFLSGLCLSKGGYKL